MPAATKDAPQQGLNLERKSLAGGDGAGVLEADDATGIVEAIVSVTGVEDAVLDTIHPGAYTKTLLARKPKGIMGHDWGRWVAKTLDIGELMPGDPRLPKETPAGQPWPAQAGALYVKAQFNLDTTEGRDAYHNVKFFGPECEWSIGYQVPRGGATRKGNGGRNIKALDLFEYSPVLFGAAPLTGSLSVKSASMASPDDSDADNDDDALEAADADDPDVIALHEQAVAEMDAAPGGWDAIDAASAVDPREEDLNDIQPAAGTGTKMVLDGEDGQPVTVEFKDGGSRVSNTPWSNFSQADYDPAQWHRACLIHDHAPGTPDSKDGCKLPVREPGGKLNRNGVHAAAGALAGSRGGVQASPDAKAKAAKTLRGMYSTIGDMPPESLQAKSLAVAGRATFGLDGPAALRARLAGGDWAGDPDGYTPQQWHSACLHHDHPDDGAIPDTKDACRMPVLTPDGAMHLEGMRAAAAAMPATGADNDTPQVKAAAAVLHTLFLAVGETPPGGLATKVAGQEATPKDVAAADRLKGWYVHGGGAALIGWNKPGDFANCVAIASKHMTPGQARGFCQLRHKDATGFYAGHAPGDQAGHATKDIGTDLELGDVSLTGGQVARQALGHTGEPYRLGPEVKDTYDPALETGPDGGTADPWTETKTGGQVLELPGSFEEIADAVADAVTGQLGGGEQLPGGLPRHLVTVQGTWPDHVIATRFDLAGTAETGDAFQVPYAWGEDGAVQCGQPEPVVLTITDDEGTKGLEDQLSGLPVLVEHLTGYMRRGLQVKAGRVLSDANAKLLRSAVGQLVSVLRGAGIQIDIPGSGPGGPDGGSNSQSSDEPLYLPDSTAPAAQVMAGKTLLDPALHARAMRIHADVHSRTAAEDTGDADA